VGIALDRVLSVGMPLRSITVDHGTAFMSGALVWVPQILTALFPEILAALS
jgi:hypothetical protein